MDESACFTLLNFEPTADPNWRQDKFPKGNVPSIREMLDCIIKTRRRWKEISQSESCNDNRIESAVENLEVLFVYHTCQQEDVGIADKDEIRQIIEDCNHGEYADHLETHKSSAYQETVHFYKAYKMLQELGKREADTDPELKGLVEVDSYILATHERLMRGSSMKTQGGRFSTEVRQTTAYGELHQYPKFETHDEARDSVLRIVDRYNRLCYSIRKDEEHEDEYFFVLNILKCAIWLFHQLLSLHPFGDGNGRLCRLVLNYAVSVVIPFPVPLHDIFGSSRDAYLRAVVAPRKSDGRPVDLMRLLVESIYDGCRTFLDDLKQVYVSESSISLPVSHEELEGKSTQKKHDGKEATSLCRTLDGWNGMGSINQVLGGRSVLVGC